MSLDLSWLVLSLVAFLSSVLSGVAGFGGAMIFLPVLVAFYGTRPSVPILTIAVLMGNASRVYFFRKHLNLKIVSLFSLGSVPFAIFGSFCYISLPAFWIKKAIGFFLVSSVIYNRLYQPLKFRKAWLFTSLGAVSGFLSAIVGGIGPFSAPFFLAYGLSKETFVGTEAFCAVGMHLTKSLSYYQFRVLGKNELTLGLLFGAWMAAGSYLAKRILEKLSREHFLILVETLLLVIGGTMLFKR